MSNLCEYLIIAVSEISTKSRMVKLFGDFMPRCRAAFNSDHRGYHFTQCRHDMCWCVDTRGNPKSGTLSWGFVDCNTDGKFKVDVPI